MNPYKKYFLIGLFLLPALAYAQVYTLNGVIYKKNTNERVAQAIITNLHSKDVMMCDELGGFSIKAEKGDTLLYSRSGYSPQKQVVTSTNDIIVYLQSIINLSEVTVKGQTKKQELNEVMAEYRSQGTFYDGKPPAWVFLNSPITGLYELFGKLPNEARRFQAYSTEELEHTEVSKRYNKALVKQVTNLPDDEVKKFMDSYTPAYEDVKGWNDYELIAHIKKAYVFYRKNKNREPPSPLKGEQ